MVKQLSSKKQRQYIKEIKRLAALLPPMNGHDHLLNMMGLFKLHGPDGVKGYIMAIDTILKKIEDMKVVINNDGTTIGESTLNKGDIIDLPTLNAKAAIATGKASADPEDEFNPEVVAESVNHAVEEQ